MASNVNSTYDSVEIILNQITANNAFAAKSYICDLRRLLGQSETNRFDTKSLNGLVQIYQTSLDCHADIRRLVEQKICKLEQQVAALDGFYLGINRSERVALKALYHEKLIDMGVKPSQLMQLAECELRFLEQHIDLLELLKSEGVLISDLIEMKKEMREGIVEQAAQLVKKAKNELSQHSCYIEMARAKSSPNLSRIAIDA